MHLNLSALGAAIIKRTFCHFLFEVIANPIIPTVQTPVFAKLHSFAQTRTCEWPLTVTPLLLRGYSCRPSPEKTQEAPSNICSSGATEVKLASKVWKRLLHTMELFHL